MIYSMSDICYIVDTIIIIIIIAGALWLQMLTALNLHSSLLCQSSSSLHGILNSLFSQYSGRSLFLLFMGTSDNLFWHLSLIMCITWPYHMRSYILSCQWWCLLCSSSLWWCNSIPGPMLKPLGRLSGKQALGSPSSSQSIFPHFSLPVANIQIHICGRLYIGLVSVNLAFNFILFDQRSEFNFWTAVHPYTNLLCIP